MNKKSVIRKKNYTRQERNGHLISKIIIAFCWLTTAVLFLLLMSTTGQAWANVDNLHEEIFEAVVKKIEPRGEKGEQFIKIEVVSGGLRGRLLEIKAGEFQYRAGDRVLVARPRDPEAKNEFYIKELVRKKPLLWLFAIFVGLTIAVGRLRGLGSLLGLAISFGVIFVLILPRIFKGGDPLIWVILGSMIIIPITFILSHGINKKTKAAIGGTLISIIITGLLAKMFIGASRLSGFASEEAVYLQAIKGINFNYVNLILAGMIVGVIGVLDDVTISQAAIVEELKKATQLKLSRWQLYEKAMNVGREHIASMVNTLVLVYAGASLPLLLLFVDSQYSMGQVINYEIIAEEIIRMLVGSIGLILAVPITTAIAVMHIGQQKHKKSN